MRDALGTGGHDLENLEWHVSASGEFPRASQHFCLQPLLHTKQLALSRRDSGFGFILVDTIVLLAR